MFPVVPTVPGRVASGSATDRPIDRVDRPDALEIETARRESRNRDDERPASHQREPAAESAIQLRSIDRTIGTLLDVVA